MTFCCRFWHAELACECPCLQTRETITGEMEHHAYLCNAILATTKVFFGYAVCQRIANRLKLPGVVEGLAPWLGFSTVVVSEDFSSGCLARCGAKSIFFGVIACFGVRSLSRVNTAFPQMVTCPNLVNVIATLAYALGSGFGLVVPLRFGTRFIWSKYRQPPPHLQGI